MIFGVPVPCTTLSGKPECREDAVGDSRGLREGLNEFLPILPIFLDRTERNSVEVICTKFCWAVQSFVKIGEPENPTAPEDAYDIFNGVLCTFRPIRVQFVTRRVHIRVILLDISDRYQIFY